MVCTPEFFESHTVASLSLSPNDCRPNAYQAFNPEIQSSAHPRVSSVKPANSHCTVRDDFENNKEDWAEQLKGITGVDWKIEINPLAIYPYADSDYPKQSLGSCLKSYVDGAIYKISYFKDTYGADGIKELNEVAFAHSINMEVDERDKKKGLVTYCGSKIKDGVLTIIFNPTALGTNSGDGLYYLLETLNEASQVAEGSSGPTVLSSAARLGISADYNPGIEDIEDKLKAMTKNDNFILDPNWEENYQNIRAVAAKESGEDWERRMGRTVLSYFDGAAYKMDYYKIGEDEMLQEGFNEAVDKGKIVIRVVKKLTRGISSYCECVVEDGILYIQTTPEKWGINVGDGVEKLVDIL
jgi:hypothetical protein